MNNTRILDVPSIFAFRHPELRGPGIEFARDEDRNPIMKKNFGTMNGTTFVADLAESLGLEAGDPDRNLLAVVPHALRHVRTITNGDQIPTELITGRPSWDPGQRSIARATETLWRATSATAGEPGCAIISPEPSVEKARAVQIRNASEIFKGLSDERSIEIIDDIVVDLARLDRIRRSVLDLQRIVGDLAKFSVEYAKMPIGDLAKVAAVNFRSAVVWGTSQAVAADTIMADVYSLFENYARATEGLWPILRKLRAFVLDAEGIRECWASSKKKSDLLQFRDVEDIYRKIMRKYKEFEPDVFNDSNFSIKIIQKCSNA